MNVSTGGPHLLFFERNQQLITLLTSEFQLTGYECHAARTAVEVFDTIARHPVQLVLVNLAQAAAGRREFWVALEAQRRGRGVQVFTYRCINLAGYGADDPDEREHGAQADIEVDGMLGVMNLVDAVRARFPASPTGSLSRVSAAPVVGGQAPRVAGTGEASMATPSLATSVTSPFSAATSQSTLSTLASSSTPPRQQPAPSMINREDAQSLSPRQGDRVPTPPSSASKTTQSYTDKVRAIIYPSQTTWNPPGSSSMNSPGSASAMQSMQPTSSESGEESSLSQLSRLLQMHYTPMQNNVAREVRPEPQVRQANNTGQAGGDVLPTASAPISSQPLRASPIHDLPIERAAGGQSGGSGAGEQARKASSSFAREEYSDNDNNAALLERARSGRQEVLPRREFEMNIASETTLLDIVQSLPPMSSPPPQPPVLSGRATRSLGSVLLEGHLVPQNRLEVAQNVQRMLRGVDLNYQLGEILLMFKLLTPDQLLAASLVSYGLISTAQISALGRIRQELHSIGLEYDLENLLILFRILSPEQLREVRSTWS